MHPGVREQWKVYGVMSLLCTALRALEPCWVWEQREVSSTALTFLSPMWERDVFITV